MYASGEKVYWKTSYMSDEGYWHNNIILFGKVVADTGGEKIAIRFGNTTILKRREELTKYFDLFETDLEN